jgi:hypothetical protein
MPGTAGARFARLARRVTLRLPTRFVPLRFPGAGSTPRGERQPAA